MCSSMNYFTFISFDGKLKIPNKTYFFSAVCMNCFGEAAYTKRTSNEDSLEVIGGADKYMAACRTCHQLSDVKEATSPREREQAVAELGVSPPKKMLFAQAVSNLGSNAA